MSKRPVVPRLMGPAEMAYCLGVSMQYMAVLKRDDPLFPTPIVQLKCSDIWLADDVEVYAATRNRKPGRKKKDEGHRA
jgi:hypothetical protein